MQLRVTTLRKGAATTVRVEGGLDRDNVSTLLAEVGEAPSGVVLDLSGLRSADTVAVRDLRKLKAAGARVEGASLYVAHLLEVEVHDPGAEPPEK